MTIASANNQMQSVPKVSILRRAIFAGALFCLIALPTFLFMATLSHDLMLRGILAQFTVFGFPVLAVFAVWVTIDAQALYNLVGLRIDPFGPKALTLSALGFANVAAMFLFLILTKGK